MKKILVVLLAMVMVFSLVACKSKEQKAADKVLKKLEDCLDDYEKADGLDEKMKVASEMLEIGVEAEEAYKNLKEKDADAAEEFMKEAQELINKIS